MAEKDAVMQQPVLPALYCPFPSAVNHYAELVDERTVGWARQFELLPDEAAYRRLAATRLGWLAARTHPSASLDALQLIADWCTWLFIRDDHCDESGIGKAPPQFKTLHDRLLNVLKGAHPTVGDEPFVWALGDLRERTLARVSPPWMLQFSTHVDAFFAAGLWEAGNRAQGVIPTVQTYIKMRPFTSGMYVFIELSEVVAPMQLPTNVRQHQTMTHVTQAATIAACWTNDMVSLGKELRQGDVHNLVLTLRHQYNLSLQEAIDRAAALHDTAMRSFLDAEQRLPAFGTTVDAHIKRYLGVLRANMRGNLDWSYTTGRYLLTRANT